MGEMVKFTRLWKQKDKTGNTYLKSITQLPINPALDNDWRYSLSISNPLVILNYDNYSLLNSSSERNNSADSESGFLFFLPVSER